MERDALPLAERVGVVTGASAGIGNAAVGVLRPIADGRIEEWRAVLDTNLLGTLCLCRAALRHMLPQGRGDIVLMGSASAEVLLKEKKIKAMPDWKTALRTEFMDKARKS